MGFNYRNFPIRQVVKNFQDITVALESSKSAGGEALGVRIFPLGVKFFDSKNGGQLLAS